MATEAQIRAKEKYDKAHTQQVLFKLNRTSDADILAKLEDVENKQGYVKQLIRRDIRGNNEILSLDALRYLVRPVAKRHALDSVYLFGSYARGEATPQSDIDLLVDGGSIKTAGKYFSIRNDFCDALGKEVDLVMGSAARENHTRAGVRFMSHFERDKVLLYEKV